MPAELIPTTLVAMMAIGMAIAFFSADPRAPTSRALALAFFAAGLAIGFGFPLLALDETPPRYAGALGLLEMIAILAFLEWILRIGHTVPGADQYPGLGEKALRAGQLAGLVYGGLGLLWPELRAEDFLGALNNVDALSRLGFWLFAVPVLVSILCGATGSLVLLRRRPDKPEKLRLVAMMVAVPFIAAGLILPIEYGTVAMVIGNIIFLIGALHYHVMQGERGQFMARFLSPQVAKLVRERGLKALMKEQYVELTVVMADLRGFTAYAQGHPSTRIIHVLREYYRAAGEIVGKHGGTIKDLAGDGVLILMGAPLPMPDHPSRALQLARDLRTEVGALTRRWSTQSYPLGLGIGVASGMVTVGAIGAGDRYEYTAVGATVNLACRLCDQAADGEILVAGTTLELCRAAVQGHVAPREPIKVKGFAEPVAHFSLQAAAAA